MRTHKGEHPRMGATDVCPIIPIKDVSIEECIDYSIQLAKKVANELKIPVFLYEKSSKNVNRKNLADIRKGEYEGMKEKLTHPQGHGTFYQSHFQWYALIQLDTESKVPTAGLESSILQLQ